MLRCPRALVVVDTNRSAPWAREVPVSAVSDVREASTWYVAVLGLVEHVRVGEAHRVQLGIDGERAEVIAREVRDGERVAGTGAEIMVRVDVDAVLKAVGAAGANCLTLSGICRTGSDRAASSPHSGTSGC